MSRDDVGQPSNWAARVLVLGLYCRRRTQAMDSSNSNYSCNYILPSKRFEICRQLLRSFILSAYARRDCVGLRRFESRLTTYKMLALNSSRPTFFCVRYGYSFWPIWPFRVADVVVADMVCGRYRCGRYGLWPIWYRPVIEGGMKKSRFSTNISLYLVNDTTYGHNYNGRRITTRMRPI